MNLAKDGNIPAIINARRNSAVTVIEVLNPFDPKHQVRSMVRWGAKKTLAHYMPEMKGDVAVSVNGEIVEREEWSNRLLLPDDYVVIVPVPQGGGGKNVLRMVAMIAVAIVAPYAAYTLAGSMGMVAAGTTMAAFSTSMAGMAMAAGITIAGQMLVNAMLPVPTPGNGANQGQTQTDSPSYGIDGAKNTSQENLPVPVCYGTFRMAGNIIAMRTENVGDTQDVYILVNAGEGPIAAITDIELNDQPITNYKNWEIVTAPGTADQGVLSWFNDNYASGLTGGAVKITDQWLMHTTKSAVDKFRLDLVAPSGLIKVNDDGSTDAVSVTFDAEYSPAGLNQWTAMTEVQTVDHYVRVDHLYKNARYNDSGNLINAPQEQVTNSGVTVSNTAGGRIFVDWDEYDKKVYTYENIDSTVSGDVAGYWVAEAVMTPTAPTLSDNTRSAVRSSFTSPLLTNGIYDVRIRRTTVESTDMKVADGVMLADVVEITTADVAYRNTALLGLKVRLSDQLNGVPKVTYINHGRIIRYWRGTEKKYWWDDTTTAPPGWDEANVNNPAWVVMDAMTHQRYGGGMALERFDLAALKDWAAYCDANELTFDGVIDVEQNLWDALQPVFRAGHAQPVGVGTRFSVAIERATDPVMMFTVGNIIEGSFEENWLPMAERANEIEVSYFDEQDKYKQKTLRVVDAAALAAGTPQKTASITLFGVKSADRAAKEGQFQLNLNRYILQTLKWDADIDAIACTVGDVVYVQHDMPQWGFGGRTVSGSTDLVVALDRPVPLSSGKTYKLLVMFDSVTRYAGSVTNIVGNSVYLSGYDAAIMPRRLQVNGLDLEVLDVFDAGTSGCGVTVADATGVQVGNTYALIDTDVIEERNVVNNVTADTEVTVITVDSAFSAAPGNFVQWMFGEVGKVKKPVRIKAISGGNQYTRTITALEYNASVYDLSGVVTPTPNYSSLPTIIGQVENLQMVETLTYIGQTPRSKLTVFWDKPTTGIYDGAKVYARINGAAYVLLDTVSGGVTRYEWLTRPGDKVQVKVVAMDPTGAAAIFSSAPETDTVTTVGKTLPPATLTGLSATGDVMMIRLSLAYPADFDLTLAEIWASTTNDRTTASKLTTLIYPDTEFAHIGLDPARTFYYWARVQDSSKNWSDFYPASLTGGVSATTTSDPTRLLAQLENSITSSQLAKTLQDDIANVQDVSGLVDQLEANANDMIDGWISLNDNMDENRSNVKRLDDIDSQILTINDNITAEQTARQNLSATVDGLSSSLTTEQNARVSGDQANSQSITDLTSTVNNNKSSADSSIATLTSKTDSQAQSISSLQSSVSSNTSAITTEQQTRADADSSLSARIDTLVASSGGNTAGLDSETQARVDGDNALSDKITSLTTTVNDNDSKQTANLSTEQTARADGDNANSASITSLQGTVDSNNTAVNGRIDNVLALNLDATTALMTRFSNLDATISSNNSTVTGQINDIQNLNLTSTTALMTRFSGLDSTINNNYNNLNGKYADILNLNIASGTTLMTKINSMQSSINGNTASISSNASALASVQNGQTTLNAQYTLKVDAYGHIAGIGLASSGTDPANATSEVLIFADKFGIILPGAGSGASATMPFVVGYVNGVSTVGINGAVVVDGTIDARSITANSITADRLKAGSITADRMNVTDLSAISANLGSIVVDKAHMGTASVDTLNLAGQAVTIPVSAYSSSQFVLNPTMNGYTTVLSCTITSTGAPITVTASAAVIADKNSQNDTTIYARILRDGAVVYGPVEICTNYSPNYDMSTQFCAQISDTPGAGNHTYTLQGGYVNGGGSMTWPCITLLETKR